MEDWQTEDRNVLLRFWVFIYGLFISNTVKIPDAVASNGRVTSELYIANDMEVVVV
jgi:hypothetical protein